MTLRDTLTTLVEETTTGDHFFELNGDIEFYVTNARDVADNILDSEDMQALRRLARAAIMQSGPRSPILQYQIATLPVDVTSWILDD